MQQHLHEHFCSGNHICFISDVSVTFLDKTDPSDHLKRDYWRSTLKTMALLVLILKKVCEGSVFGTLCCVPLGAAMLGDEKFF